MGQTPEGIQLESRLQRALKVHGVRGIAFAASRRLLDTLERRLNPEHENRFSFGFTPVLPASVDPVAAMYSVEFETVVIEIALANLRWSRMGMRVDDPENPFVRTVREYRDGEWVRFEQSALECYFSTWRPASAAEVLGLDDTDAGAISTQPPGAVTLPWFAEAADVDPSKRLERLHRWNIAESRAAGARFGKDNGHKHFGPVSREFGEFEFRRYANLTESMVRHGFIAKPEHDSHIGVHVLVDGGSRVALSTGPGLHRAIVAAALGTDPLTVAIDRPPRLVYRSDVAAWPGVQSGLFSKSAALAVFDRIISGSPPRGFSVGLPAR